MSIFILFQFAQFIITYLPARGHTGGQLVTSQGPQGAKKPACSARGLIFARILSDLT